MRIALIRLSAASDLDPVAWSHGPAETVAPNPRAVRQAADRISRDQAEYLLFWHESLGAPPEDVPSVADQVGEVWHAGLCLGQGARPSMLDFVHPTWMLQIDPNPEQPGSSWRLSLKASLVPASLWRRLGGVDIGFEDLDAASLELGFRWWRAGVLLRHVPELLGSRRDAGVRLPIKELGDGDQLRFLRLTRGSFWAAWAVHRAVLTGLGSRRALVEAWWRSRGVHPAKIIYVDEEPVESSEVPGTSEDASVAVPGTSSGVSVRDSQVPGTSSGESSEVPGVSAVPDSEVPGTSPTGASPTVAVLIPTLDRYPYLSVVLEQLEQQTILPTEVVVIDQTDSSRRRRWQDVSTGLPLRVLEQDRPGQSTARNAGLRTITSDYVLFIDDDVEIEPDLIARHLAVLERFRADVSCGVTTEVGAGPLPEEFRRRRLSDVFPTCNCMARREVLERSGLFDLAFDHGSRADADLGTRIYLAGGLMVLEPSISVLHHKAPAGGLRRHGARKVTFADSRRRLTARHLPSVTELYLAMRYSSPRQVREAKVLRAFGTLKGGGGPMRKLLKLAIGWIQMPDTLLRIRRASSLAEVMLESYPRIPSLTEAGEESRRESP